MVDKKELAVLKTRVSKLETMAEDAKIETPDDYRAAADLVSKLKETGSTIKEKKESITKPLNEALKNIRSLFSPIEEPFERAEKIIKTKLLDYKRKVDQEAREREMEIARKVEAGKMKPETGEKKLAQIEQLENTVRGNTGQVQIRKIQKVRILDANLLPREYLIPDEVAIRRDALGGKPIPGVEIYFEETIAAGKF